MTAAPLAPAGEGRHERAGGQALTERGETEPTKEGKRKKRRPLGKKTAERERVEKVSRARTNISPRKLPIMFSLRIDSLPNEKAREGRERERERGEEKNNHGFEITCQSWRTEATAELFINRSGGFFRGG